MVKVSWTRLLAIFLLTVIICRWLLPVGVANATISTKFPSPVLVEKLTDGETMNRNSSLRQISITPSSEHYARQRVPSKTMLTYPPSRKSDRVDNYHGTLVADPYRWLENPDSPETRTWIEAENKVTFAYLNEIPAKEKIRQRLTKLWNYERYSIPFKEGESLVKGATERYFYFKKISGKGSHRTLLLFQK